MALPSNYKKTIRRYDRNTAKNTPQKVNSRRPKWHNGKIHLLLSILVIILNNLSTVHSYQCLHFETEGTTYPQGDINLKEGESLQIDCIINKTSPYSASDLQFLNGSEPVSPEYTRIVNDTVLRLFIPNPPLSNSNFFCNLNSKTLCYNIVNVGSAPQAVEDFQCIFYDWESLNCTWRAPQNHLRITYNLSFRIPETTGTFKCPSVNYVEETGYYNCEWNISSTPQYRQMSEKYTLFLQSYNSAGNKTQKFSYVHYSAIVPSAPIGLHIVNKTAHSVLLSWNLSFTMENFRDPPGLEHRIIYKMESDEKNTWHSVDALNLPKKGIRMFNLTGLPYAYKFYDVRIDLKVKSAEGEQYWSKFAYVTFRTLAELPARPPKTEIGSFEILKATSSKRDLYVYWEQINANEKNGGNFTYKITHIEENGASVKFTHNELTNAYALYRGVSLKALNFTIASWNDEGYSRKFSYVYVPNQGEVVPRPTSFSKIAYGNGTYELSWHPQTRDYSRPLDDYTIFWCENARDRPYQCNGQIYSKKIPPSDTIAYIDVDESKVFQFAISANAGHLSSGMVWASCTIIPGRALSKMSNVWVNSVNSTYIDIGWSLGCTDSVGVVQAYNVTYCPNPSGKDNPCEASHQQYTIINDTSTSIGRIKNLTPYTTYYIQIAPISKHGMGIFSDPLQNVTSEDAPTPPLNVRISEITNNSMLVTWKPPLKMNGRLKNYVIKYNDVKTENNGHTEMRLMNLTSYTNYTVTVQACTVRCSNLSNRIVVRTAFGSPGLITITPNKTSQQNILRWKPPKNPGGFLDTYQIEILKQFNNGNELPENFNTTALEYQLPKPICDENGVEAVIFRVRGINYDTSKDHGIAAFVGADSVNLESDPNGPFNITYFGPWSEGDYTNCMTSSNVLLFWIFGIPILIVLLFMLTLATRKVWYRLKAMRDVEISLPAGLDTTSDKETTKYPLSNWNTQMKGKDDKFSVKPSSDAISLLPNKTLGNGKDLSGSSENTDSTTLSLTSNKDCYNAKDILDNEENLSENTSNNSPNYSSEKPNYPIPLDQQYNSPYLKVTPAMPPLGNYTKGPWVDLNYFGSLEDEHIDDEALDSISQNTGATPYSENKKQDKIFGNYVLGITPQAQYECPNYGKAAILPQPVFFNPTFRQSLPVGYVQHTPANDFIPRPQAELPPAVNPLNEANKMPTGYVRFDDPSAKPDQISTISPDVYNGYVKDNSLRYDQKIADLQADLRVTPQTEPHYVKENPLLLDPDLKIKHDEPFIPRKLPKLPSFSEKISSGYVSAKDPMMNKRLNLSNVSSNGDEVSSPDSALSPEAYCRFGWNSDPNLEDGTDFELLLDNKLILDKSKDKKLNDEKNSYLPINTNLSKE